VSELTTVDNFLANFTYGSSLTVKKNSTVISGSNYVGTGCIVTDGSKSYILVQYGDINGDGKIAAADYMMIKKSLTGSVTLTAAQAAAADCDNNGAVAVTDYMKVKAYIKGTFVLYK